MARPTSPSARRPRPHRRPWTWARWSASSPPSGVGIGALGTLLGGFVSGFMDLRPWWAKLVAVAGVGLVISGPSVVISWLKLRHRTLGPILEANGWAVNGRVRINLPLGTALTDRAALPAGARRVLEDPYADKASRRRRRIFWLLVLAVAGALAAARYFGKWPFGPPFWTSLWPR
jgi:hypothetical protein